MYTIERILVPFDFSKVAGAAISCALQLAEQHGAVVHLVCAEPNLDGEIKKRITSAPTGTFVEDTIVGDESAMLEAVELEYKRAAEAGHELKRVEVVPHVSGSDFPEAALELVADLEIDLIVTPTHGRQGLLGALFGSASESLVGKAPCSVFVVKPQGYPYLRD